MRERDSCSSRESHKSSSALSQRSSQDDVVVESSRRPGTPDNTPRLTQSQPSTLKYHRQREHRKVTLEKEIPSKGHHKEIEKAEVYSKNITKENSSEELKSSKIRTSGPVMSGTVEDLRLNKLDKINNSDRDKSPIYPSMSRIEKVLSNDISDDPIDFSALRKDIRQLEKDTIRRRQEFIKPKEGEVWTDFKSGLLSSGGDSAISPTTAAYRSLRSLTPEEADESTSFHESFEKEYRRRRRVRQRSASCSSRCCENEHCCRLDSCPSRSTQSVTGSSRSEKSSTRSSRSPSIEQIKQGCNASKCRARTNIC